MKTEDFNYSLPEELIAQTPLEKRDESKLMLLNINNSEIKHTKFHDIINYLDKNDVLVINNTKVIPARLIGIKEETKAIIELLLLSNLNNDIWECLAKPVKRLKIGTIISFGEGRLKAKVLAIKEEGIIEIELLYDGILMEILDKLGTMPLPPYIYEKLKDQNRYQTVYAKNVGSSAAPTAGLHFTNELLKEIQKKGIKLAQITLHVGLGTFRPVQVDDIKKHKMHSEYYTIDDKNANLLNNAIKNKKRIIAVGTTTARTLETLLQNTNEFKRASGYTDIFIYPGYKFKAINGLITNFHLPKSTLLMLVSAFASKELIMNAYKEAINKKYRFFSFGDAMFLIGSDKNGK